MASQYMLAGRFTAIQIPTTGLVIRSNRYLAEEITTILIALLPGPTTLLRAVVRQEVQAAAVVHRQAAAVAEQHVQPGVATNS